MPFKPAALVVAGLVAATVLSGCAGLGGYESDFPIVVVNKTVNTLQVFANGNTVGQVVANQTGSFSLHLSESNQNVLTNGVAPTPQAQVTFTARDMRTGLLSAEKSLTLSGNTPTYVTFGAADFPNTGPTIARFVSSPTAPSINADVSFNASTSTVNSGTFAWDFGDGQTGSGVTVTHQYSRPAQYTVVLTVTSDTGASSTASRTVTVSATLPAAANFTFSPTNPAINQSVVFTATVPPNVVGASFTWDFGDGGTGFGATITHQYARSGIFTISLRLTSDTGQAATTTRTITVSATSGQVVARFTFSPTAPAINDVVFFNASSSTVTNGSYAWDFGDGSRSTGVTPTHQYSRAATFTVTMTVTSDLAQSATVSSMITVSATSSQVVARFTFSPTTPGVNDDVFFNASASTATNGTGAWDFGDGTRGVGVAPIHQYARAGTYTVTLTVTNDLGQSATTSSPITVSATSSQVVARFTFSPTTPGVSDDVFFNASSSTVTNGTFAWDFGDGTRGVGVAPTHQYSRAATYTVTLTVTNGLGQSAAASITVPVSPNSTVAAFTFSPTNPTISRGTNTVIFDATPSSAGVTSWVWDFGDGSTAGTGQRTTHTFSVVGTWVVRLTVTDAAGRTATTVQNVPVVQ